MKEVYRLSLKTKAYANVLRFLDFLFIITKICFAMILWIFCACVCITEITALMLLLTPRSAWGRFIVVRVINDSTLLPSSAEVFQNTWRPELEHGIRAIVTER